MDYQASYGKLVFMDSGEVGVVEEITMAVTVLKERLLVGEYVEVQTNPIISQLSDFMVVYKVGTGDPRMKGFSEFRVGYYGGVWETVVGQYALPLDPKKMVKYIANPATIYSGSVNEAVAICWILRLRSDYDANTQTFTDDTIVSGTREVHICPFWCGISELPGNFIESFTFLDESASSYTF